MARANFSSSWTTTYSDNHSSNYSDSAYWWYYISAASFVVDVSCSYHWWASAHLIVYIAYYNRSTNTWTDIVWKDYVNGKNSENLKFYHNRDTEAANGTFNYRDDSVSRYCHLFRVGIRKTYGSSQGYITVYCGGPGMMTDSEYNTYLKGRKIQSNGNLANDSSGYVWLTGRSTAESAPNATAINMFNPANNRGTVIYDSYASHCLHDPYWT